MTSEKLERGTTMSLRATNLTKFSLSTEGVKCRGMEPHSLELSWYQLFRGGKGAARARREQAIHEGLSKLQSEDGSEVGNR